MSSAPHVSPDAPASTADGTPLPEPAVLHHAIFLPLPGEAPQAYAARLRAIQHHLTMLIEAVERGMGREAPRRHGAERPAGAADEGEPPVIVMTRPPMLAPVPEVRIVTPPVEPNPAPRAEPAVDPAERRRPTDRRGGLRDRRRIGHRDRRRGLPDLRDDRVERRVGPPDRRSGRRDRRVGHDRRVEARRVATPLVSRQGALDPMAVFWGVNIACWLAIVAIAMIWGVG